MKHKIGDKVRIKSIDCYNENKDERGIIRCDIEAFVPDMSEYCGNVATITAVRERKERFQLDIDDGLWSWTDDMFEELVEEEVGLVDNLSSRWVNEFNLPEGYIFKDENGNVINTTRIVVEKKKKEYPKTYEECCKVIGINRHDVEIDLPQPYQQKMFNLFKLHICRDAYWKIAGEEMGLGKPWEPNYDSGVNKYGIICMNGVIQKSTPTTNWERHLNKVLDFPTEEMRDAFYENFKELIEQCKELL